MQNYSAQNGKLGCLRRMKDCFALRLKRTIQLSSGAEIFSTWPHWHRWRRLFSAGGVDVLPEEEED